MAFKRGTGTVQVELARLQFWAEETSVTLDGQNGDIGMVREWRDFKSQREAMDKFIKVGFLVLGFICGVPAMLVSLMALGVIHLR